MDAQNEQGVVVDFFCTLIIYFLILRNKEKVEGLTFPIPLIFFRKLIFSLDTGISSHLWC